ncbi:hypothetical protein [Echinicola shivajiensis]|uniref:hypothetical protein n=1 Tax=Echinicola shivajiensis TaxID=1035916 RepID=UPI001BFC4FAC|nr:hypothetical protein [Echinicola shivajiensis]
MKIKIVKPFNKSGYFANQEIEINPELLEVIKKYNEVEIIETAAIDDKSNEKAVNKESIIREPINTNNIEKAVKPTVKRGRKAKK